MLKTTFIAHLVHNNADWYFLIVNVGDCYQVSLDTNCPSYRLNITKKIVPPKIPMFIRIENKKHTRAFVADAIKALAK